MTDPLKIQHGGTHYKGLAIQPFEISMANQYDALIHTIIKYVPRHASKGGEEDLDKAIHCCQLRVVLGKNAPVCLDTIPISTYVLKNHIPDPEALAVIFAHDWAFNGTVSADDVIQAIQTVKELRYPK